MLAQFASVHEEILRSGGAVVAIAPAAAYQARHLAATSVPFGLFIDEGSAVTRRLAFRRRSLAAFVFDLRAWSRWLAALVRHRRQGRVTGHHSSVPGVVVVTSGGDVVWSHEGRGIGDYPAPGEIRAALDRLIASEEGDLR